MLKKMKDRRKDFLKRHGMLSYVCSQCNTEEKIPEDVVVYFDMMDTGDPFVPPRFRCEKCGGEMYPQEPWVNLLEDWEEAAERFYRESRRTK